MKIAYLGPQASFTQLVASRLFTEVEFVPQQTIRDCFHAVLTDEVEKAVVPLENSIEGTVSMTLDLLYDYDNIFIEAEAVLPVSHHLMVHPNSAKVEKIYSHPQALAQTFNFRFEHYKNVPAQEFSSTAAAAKRVAEHPEENWAAIANEYAAKLYGLKILHENIQDVARNHTRFIVISRTQHPIELNLRQTTAKTSLFVTLPDDHAGGLHQVLSVFAWRRMNLSKIESRTLKTGLGNYFFYINVDGDWENVLYQNSLEELRSIGASVRFLGNYHEYLV
ncbi:prephenate dehydratase [Weeksellaceae bacterium A-14]|uniref:prephenate dehydratase n=1 Tax=Daejeonia sp. YH14 TaxID=3439042 RepID=UPI0031E4CFEE